MDLKTSQLRKRLINISIFLSFVPFLIFFVIDPGMPDLVSRSANLFGFIGAVFLIWQFVLGIRGVVKNISSDYDWAIKTHTFLGIGGGLFVILHPLLINLSNDVSLLAIFALDFSNEYTTYLSYGKISFLLFLTVWFTSWLLRKSLTYRAWLYIHYLSYPMLFFMLAHPFKIGTILNSNSFVQGYWYFLILTSLIAILIKLADILNLTFQKYIVEKVSFLPGDIYTITYKITGDFPQISSGQYFYIKNKYFGESHPFTVLDYDSENKNITFGIKSLGKFTENLKNTKINDFHYIDGPFGEFTLEGQNEEPKVILAGGIGITPFYRLVKDFGNEDTYLFYANQKIDFALFRNEFKNLLKNNYFDFISHEQINGKNIYCETITSSKIKEIVHDLELKTVNFFICGSPGFTKAMINCLSDIGVSRNKIFIEEFEY